ncbi:hypothetical protein [Burkholderia sp. JP2-270]|uniref:hypothetical protein n=1 Tax=Burkholderia sp. JP2-270 TaxID=2217913 RepID=UPI0013A6D8CD|nr:hypothetical protein [Burkholderia sp. JP2-270]
MGSGKSLCSLQIRRIANVYRTLATRSGLRDEGRDEGRDDDAWGREAQATPRADGECREDERGRSNECDGIHGDAPLRWQQPGACAMKRTASLVVTGVPAAEEADAPDASNALDRHANRPYGALPASSASQLPGADRAASGDPVRARRASHH